MGVRVGDGSEGSIIESLLRLGIHAHSASEDNGQELNNRVFKVEQDESVGVVVYRSMWMEREYANTLHKIQKKNKRKRVGGKEVGVRVEKEGAQERKKEKPMWKEKGVWDQESDRKKMWG
ncbi:hypothetical protein Q8A73_016337 [Channa argus]|nr:hypothetical protein Q8A73_016337 [Channa argus]